MHIHICTHTYTCIHTHTHIDIHSHIHMHIHKHTHMYIYSQICIYSCPHKQTLMHTLELMNIQAQTHTLNIYTNTHAHTNVMFLIIKENFDSI